jgi:hypothetical protein
MVTHQMREAHFELWMHTFLRFLQVVLHQISARFAAFLLVAQRCVRSSAAAATAWPRLLSAARLWQIQVKTPSSHSVDGVAS